MKTGLFLFGTVGSPITTPKKPGECIGAIRQISDLSLRTLELGWVQSVRITETTCQAIKEASTAGYMQELWGRFK